MVKKMLERAIEIEGLLRIIRDGNALPEIYTLLSSKAAELAESAMLLENGNANEQKSGYKGKAAGAITNETPMIVMTENPKETGREEESTRQTAQAIVMTSDVPSTTHDVTGIHEELTEAEDEEINVSQERPSTGTENTSFKSPQSTFEEEEEDDIILTIEDEEETAPIQNVIQPKEEAPVIKEAPIIKIDKQEDITPKTQLKKSENLKPALKRQTKLKSVFSLNDRFLYSRELFEGNMKMFDSTLDFIEGIEEFSIIEDYFYNELEWDPENMAVASFMEILRPHFKE